MKKNKSVSNRENSFFFTTDFNPTKVLTSSFKKLPRTFERTENGLDKNVERKKESMQNCFYNSHKRMK